MQGLKRRLAAWQTELATYLGRGRRRRIAKELALRIFRDGLPRTASAMAFDLFLAAVPMLALAGWVLAQVLKGSEGALATSSILFDVTPADMHGFITTHFERLRAVELAPLALIAGCWLSSSAFHSLLRTIEIALRVEARPWIRTRLISMVCALFGIAALALNGYLGLVIAAGSGNALVSYVLSPLVDGPIDATWLIVLIALAMTTLSLLALFRVAAGRERSKRHLVPGVVLAVLVGALASSLLGYYAASLPRFAVFYGSLAAVAITMAWLWIWSFSVLLGAELNALLERDARRRSRSAPSG